MENTSKDSDNIVQTNNNKLSTKFLQGQFPMKCSACVLRHRSSHQRTREIWWICTQDELRWTAILGINFVRTLQQCFVLRRIVEHPPFKLGIAIIFREWERATYHGHCWRAEDVLFQLLSRLLIPFPNLRHHFFRLLFSRLLIGIARTKPQLLQL